MSTTSISLNLDSSDYSAQLSFQVVLNNCVVFATQHVTALTTITIAVDDVDAEHELKFVLTNKTQDHTTVDEQGNILSDAVLSVSDISFDGSKLGHMVFEQTSYHHDTNGSAEMSQHEFYGTMGCNGYVSLKFATPMYIWLLENT
jgi:hypothetical protein|tara:strand:+ start:6166 stop:6600 length:435 start_codon:yes stop_codon:yes gene_type:complete